MIIPLLRRLVYVLAAERAFRRVGRRRGTLDDNERTLIVAETMQLVAPPAPRLLGGEVIDVKMYRRFLSASNWDPRKASALLEADFAWRKRYKPHRLRPRDMPVMCRQRGWQVLMRPPQPWRDSLHPPHQKPPFVRWRYTRQGMPVTVFDVGEWHPHRASHAERVRHVAYHMEHYMRRLPHRKGGKRVQRCCFIMDMRGFTASKLPHVRECINVLRNHYPGRLGAACFINVPGYFYPAWKIISPWLNEEILEKTFFLPARVTDFEGAIAWVDRRGLPDPTIEP